MYVWYKKFVYGLQIKLICMEEFHNNFFVGVAINTDIEVLIVI